MKKLTLTVVILIALIIVTIKASQAQTTPPWNTNGDLSIAGQEACWKSSPLSLTQDQVKAIENIQQSYMSEVMLLRRELMSLRLELRHLITDQNVPSKTLFERQRRISELHGKLEILFLSYQIKARSIFTKEQWEQLPEDCTLGIESGFGMDAGTRRGVWKRFPR